ncbi:hypothetical protein LX36DRAFT_413769 [Colletotrichum falcatum]|nr:hypothetical protein LX36DRAFT_413769 [Colletotrichum falcatum]
MTLSLPCLVRTRPGIGQPDTRGKSSSSRNNSLPTRVPKSHSVPADHEVKPGETRTHTHAQSSSMFGDWGLGHPEIDESSLTARPSSTQNGIKPILSPTFQHPL